MENTIRETGKLMCWTGLNGSTLSFAVRCRHKDSCHSISSHPDDLEADFPLELR
ncbi:unnamed protein product [Tetraodon nigroviridis]|uniref:(spotted green pufferfish) hypothetical protein n=1 Tax=Tetraodon nigroviridis TaxID=99883 RepID=Q4S1Q9_TETNG|nr:unnamed protein product [Tetraodon nigroviridis]